MNNSRPISIKFLILAAIGFVVVVVAGSAFLMHLNSTQNRVIIKNLSSCTAGITANSKDILSKKLYHIVEAQNQLANKKTRRSYQAVIRDGSCKTKTYQSDGGTSFGTTAIVDLKSAGYSYKIRFAWLKSSVSAPTNIDLGTTEAYCLSSSELAYQEFDCQSNHLTTVEPDPIEHYLPKVGEYYTLTSISYPESPRQLALLITYDPPSNYYLENKISAFKQSVSKEIDNFFAEIELDRKDYVFLEKFAIVE